MYLPGIYFKDSFITKYKNYKIIVRFVYHPLDDSGSCIQEFWTFNVCTHYLHVHVNVQHYQHYSDLFVEYI